MTTDTVTIWVTKYALSDCVRRYDLPAKDVHDDGVAVVRTSPNGWQLYLHGEGREWHRSEASALARAEAMRKAKIASLKKQITKLEALTSEVKPGEVYQL